MVRLSSMASWIQLSEHRAHDGETPNGKYGCPHQCISQLQREFCRVASEKQRVQNRQGDFGRWVVVGGGEVQLTDIKISCER